MNSKVVSLTDKRSQMPADATILREGGRTLIRIGSVLYSPTDIYRLAQEILFAESITPEGEKFVSDIRGVVKGDGPEGERFRPSANRQMAGTHTGMSQAPLG